MTITAAELEQNLSKYLEVAEHEDVNITRDGKAVVRLSRPRQERSGEEMFPPITTTEERRAALESLIGILPSDADFEAAREERLSKI